MSGKIEARILKGFRDYLPDEMIPRNKMITQIVEVFERFGFMPLTTPCLEYSDILLGKLGADAEKLLYRFTDNGERDVCMRYDLTLPLARVVAQYPTLPRPFKRYQIAPVWRAEKPARGRFREFVQCDVDIVGSTSLAADAECIQVDYQVMKALGVEDIEIHINNRKVLEGVARLAGAETVEASHAVFRTIDKLSGQGEDVVRKLLAEENGLTPGAIDRILAFLAQTGSNEKILNDVSLIFSGIDIAEQGLRELREVLELAIAGGVPEKVVKLDMSIARGLDYYTGTVFETTLLALPQVGSVMSGGRYDKLISMFTGSDIPAVGISVGLDRLFAALTELGRIKSAERTAQIFLGFLADGCRAGALELANLLRTSGLNVEMYFDADKPGKLLKKANARNYPVAVLLGPDELANEMATVKNMISGEQETVTRHELVASIKNILNTPTNK